MPTNLLSSVPPTARRWGCIRLWPLLVGVLLPLSVRADLADPPWYQPADGSWHYRVQVQLPTTSTVHSQLVVDVNYLDLLAAMGVDTAAVTLDPQSPRLVNSQGALVAEQEFSFHRFNNVLDAAGNGRGELRFILQDDPAAGPYYLYFDILQNGAKPANPALPVNGNFEHSQGTLPLRWTTGSLNAGGSPQNLVQHSTLGSSVALTPACGAGFGIGSQTVATGPNTFAGQPTGTAWHLLGYRNSCEAGAGPQQLFVEREIQVPAGTAAGELRFFFRLQGWDGVRNNNNFDWLSVLIDGVPIDPAGLNINNSAPALFMDSARISKSVSGFFSRLAYEDFGWRQASLDLTPYAGSSISFRVQMRYGQGDNDYRSWVMLDDVTWSEQAATLGTPEAFGANIIAPHDSALGAASVYVAGELLRIQVQTDALASNVTADLLNPQGVPVATGIMLFDDGSRGDVQAGDGIWSNDGTDPAYSTYLFSASDAMADDWLLRVYVRDAAPSSAAGAQGLLRRPGQPASPLSQANYFNVDEQTLRVQTATLQLSRTLVASWDPVHGAAASRAIPGAWLTYQVQLLNTGATAANDISLVEQLDDRLSLCVSSTCMEGAAPIQVGDIPGAPASGLPFDPDADLVFSVDGLDFDYLPSPDADGFDAAVRYLRLQVQGELPAPNPDPVGVQLQYRVRVE